MKSKILDDYVNLSALDLTYIAATNKQENNSPNMDRFEFLEVLVRLANKKFIETKQIRRYPEALDKLLKEHILPNFKPLEGW